MRRIVLALAATASALVLLFSYHTSTGRPTTVVSAPGVTGSTSSTAPSSGTDGTTSGGTSGNSHDTTVNGSVAQTRWGPVQVRITVTSGRVTDVTPLQVPQGNGRDVEINSYAVPILNQEALAAQTANIDVVSGATVTSDGYIQSLQAALDSAGIG